MGRVHTATRSRLGVEKVRKATMVGMDITRSHMEAGLLRRRARRHLDAFASNNEPELEAEANLEAVNSDMDIGSSDGNPEVTADLLNFEKLAVQLVASSAEDVDSDAEPEEPELDDAPVPPPATTSSQPRRTASRSAVPTPAPPPPAPNATSQPQATRRTRKTRTRIPLKVLFIYPTGLDASLNGMDDFWKGGVKNLENEAEVLEMLSACGDDTSVDGVTVQSEVDAQTT